MSKKQIDLTTNVMSRIERDHIAMKPKWYFALGSIAMIVGLVGLSIILMFLVNLTIFSLRTHGPMGDVRYQQLLATFPWWAPVIVIGGLGFGVWLLKKYDFSYKKNFLFVVIGFIVAIFFAGFVADSLGLNTILLRQKQMRGVYQLENQNNSPTKGQGNGQGRRIQK
ncbi:MAG: hypothetical protein WAV51_02210 [Microgenomates group bacterium]